MDDIKAVIAIFIFCASTYLVFDLFINGFNFYVLLGAIIGFALVHMIWPKSRDHESAWYDSLEFIFDLPYQTMARGLRLIGIKSGKSDIDMDL